MKGRDKSYKWVCRLAVGLLLVVMASCSSTRKLEREPSVGGLTGRLYVEKVIENAPDWDRVSGKVAIALNVDGKTTRFTASMRIKRGEVIQLSVAPLLGIEVARAEISPDGLLLIDRLHKRYVNASFKALETLAQTDLNFHILQALFLNELFLPDKTAIMHEDASRFEISSVDQRAHLRVKGTRSMDYSFYTTVEEGWLEESCIAKKNTPYQLKWTYRDFKALDGKPFPVDVEAAFIGTDKKLELSMQFSRLAVGGDWAIHTEIPSKYQKIEVTELLKMLVK